MRSTEIVFSPDVEAGERERLAQAISRGELSRPSPTSVVFPVSGLVAGGLGAVLAAIQMSVGLAWFVFLVFVIVPTLGVSAAALRPWMRARQEWLSGRDAVEELEQARQSGRVIFQASDFDRAAQDMFRTVQDEVGRVAASRAYREGHLEGGLALLEAQQWRIATALVQLSDARRLLDKTGARLTEHRDAVRATEEAVEERVRAVAAYTESVRRVDATLADIDAASYTETLDNKLRDALAALGEDQSLAALTAESQDAHSAMENALGELRHHTNVLRSAADDDT